jgi:hypothetical protein
VTFCTAACNKTSTPSSAINSRRAPATSGSSRSRSHDPTWTIVTRVLVVKVRNQDAARAESLPNTYLSKTIVQFARRRERTAAAGALLGAFLVDCLLQNPHPVSIL